MSNIRPRVSFAPELDSKKSRMNSAPNKASTTCCVRRGSIRRRASMSTSLPTITEERNHESTTSSITSTIDSEKQQRRRSSVTFSADISEVKEYKASTSYTREHFYSEQDIFQFRQEAMFEQHSRRTRRSSTGSAGPPLMYGMSVPNGYPYIGPMARRGSNSSSESDCSGGSSASDSVQSAASKTSASSSTVHPAPVSNPSSSTAYVPMVTFAKLASRKKQIRSMTSLMSHGLNLGPASGGGPRRSPTSPSRHHSTGRRASGGGGGGGTVVRSTHTTLSSTTTTTATTTTTTSSVIQEEKSYEFSNSGGFSVPLDEVRNVMGSSSANPQDLTGAQFVSVSCPMPDRPSTARIA